jgi:hypothetical protein
MKKISSGTLNQKLKRETTKPIDAANSRIRKIAGIAIRSEFQKWSGICPCVHALR